MRRTDRLFDLIQILRDGRLHRASEIAAQLDVSVRTIWRDMHMARVHHMRRTGKRFNGQRPLLKAGTHQRDQPVLGQTGDDAGEVHAGIAPDQAVVLICETVAVPLTVA